MISCWTHAVNFNIKYAQFDNVDEEETAVFRITSLCNAAEAGTYLQIKFFDTE